MSTNFKTITKRADGEDIGISVTCKACEKAVDFSGTYEAVRRKRIDFILVSVQGVKAILC